MSEGDALVGLDAVRCLSVLDTRGQFHPCYDGGDTFFHPARPSGRVDRSDT
ncbi:MAG: hypothetical protein FD153_811, partial [Rhodospirillaceae bacterium]